MVVVAVVDSVDESVEEAVDVAEVLCIEDSVVVTVVPADPICVVVAVVDIEVVHMSMFLEHAHNRARLPRG